MKWTKDNNSENYNITITTLKEKSKLRKMADLRTDSSN